MSRSVRGSPMTRAVQSRARSMPESSATSASFRGGTIGHAEYGDLPVLPLDQDRAAQQPEGDPVTAAAAPVPGVLHRLGVRSLEGAQGPADALLADEIRRDH